MTHASHLPPRSASTPLDRMRLFYNLFPYPHRPLLAFPRPAGSVTAHGGFFSLILKGEKQKARNLWEACRQGQSDAAHLGEVRAAFPREAQIVLVGSGTDEPVLFRALHPENPLMAIDLSEASLKRARLRVSLADLRSLRPPCRGTRFLAGDATKILNDEPKFSADFIQCFGVLHHQPDPEPLVAAMARALRSGGVLRLMIYSRRGRALERRVQERFRDLWESENPSGALRRALRRLWFWQVRQQAAGREALRRRFAYLGLSRRAIADAFLHPSDPGLDPERLRSVLASHDLSLVFFEAKDGEGWFMGFAEDREAWERLVTQERRGELLSNVIFAVVKNTPQN